jgi:hypothetical protein
MMRAESLFPQSFRAVLPPFQIHFQHFDLPDRFNLPTQLTVSVSKTPVLKMDEV